jgi:hypothetical protein
MDEARKLEALKIMSSTYRSAFDKRREYEWKILTAALTLDVLAVAAKYAGQLQFKSSPSAIVIVTLAALILSSLTAGYLRHIHRMNGVDKLFCHAAENELIRLLELPALETAMASAIASGKRHPDWSYSWQVAAICIVTFTSAALILAP